MNSTTVLFQPHEKQKQFIEAVFSNKFKYLLFGGAAGGGKSFVSLATAVLYCRLFPNSKGFAIRESLPTLKRTTIPTFFKVCPKSFIKSYNQTDQVVKFNNGSQLIFFPENYVQDKNLTRFDGIEANFFIMEEGQELQKKTFEKCKLRVGRNIIPEMIKQPPPLILITCNPSPNWTKQIFHEPFTNGTLSPDHFYLRALMSDNPSLPESYLEGLKNLDEITREIFVNGNWEVSDVERPFAYSFNKFKNVKKGLTINKNEPLILSFDFNVDPITCLAGQSYDDQITIIKEFRLRNSDIYSLCAEINQTFGDQFYLITGDASGNARHAITRGALNFYKIIQEELNVPRSAFRVPSVNPSIKNSRVLLNSILEKHPNFSIDATCQYLIDDLINVESNEEGGIEKSKDARRTHLLDCLRYFLWTFNSDFIKYLK